MQWDTINTVRKTELSLSSTEYPVIYIIERLTQIQCNDTDQSQTRSIFTKRRTWTVSTERKLSFPKKVINCHCTSKHIYSKNIFFWLSFLPWVCSCSSGLLTTWDQMMDLCNRIQATQASLNFARLWILALQKLGFLSVYLWNHACKLGHLLSSLLAPSSVYTFVYSTPCILAKYNIQSSARTPGGTLAKSSPGLLWFWKNPPSYRNTALRIVCELAWHGSGIQVINFCSLSTPVKLKYILESLMIICTRIATFWWN